jgi:hypothetical protein
MRPVLARAIRPWSYHAVPYRIPLVSTARAASSNQQAQSSTAYHYNHHHHIRSLSSSNSHQQDTVDLRKVISGMYERDDMLCG